MTNNKQRYQEFRNALATRPLVLDGSMGALLQGRGLPAGMAPDLWMLENENVILGAHSEYVEAGADILLTNTFGASRWRLAEYQSEHLLDKINHKAVEIARRAFQGRNGFVAGDIGPSGETVYPTGHKSFEEVCEVFKEQAESLIRAGVDLIVVETMFDSLEFRAALSAIRSVSLDVPIIAHATFNVDGITDTGATPENIAAIAEGFHCDAVGVNCSVGPEPMINVVKRLRSNASEEIAVCVQPNAGLPVIKDGKTAFPMSPEDMVPFVEKFLDAGASIIGGCCGTTPKYISLVSQIAKKRSRLPAKPITGVAISSLSGFVRLGGTHPFLPIGERMNPSGRKKLSESLKLNDLSLLKADADLQASRGAKLLDLNVGVPLVDEPALMKKAVVMVQNAHPNIALMIDSANSHALDSGASVYYGRPLLNSLNAEDEKLEEAIPYMRKHGAAIVCMTTGVMVPELAVDRIKNAVKIVDILVKEHGFRERDFVFDCLGLVVSAMQKGSYETLKTIELIKERFPTSATTLGLSNVSFGLPNRMFVHSAFLAQAINRGLDSAIMSVTEPVSLALASAAEMWSEKEDSIQRFITKFSEKIETGSSTGASHGVVGTEKKNKISEPDFLSKVPKLDQDVFRAIVEGDKGGIEKLILTFLSERPKDAMDLFLNVMTPAIRHLGDLFGARVKFIPHLIAAADAMKVGVALLEPELVKARAGGEPKGTIVFATVKGDIHDIGKNICILMLRNFGYEVIDLGRNVEAELILNTAIESKAKVIALSALMTTTMMQMKVVIDHVKEKQLKCKVVIGGAVVTPDFAREIQADGFSTDVGTVVSEMERVLAILNALDAK